MEKVTTEELRELNKKHDDLLVINVLPEEEYEQAHIPGSVNFSAMDKEFVQQVKRKVDSNQTPIAVYCSDEHCGLSETAAKRLEAAGFENVYDYSGGTKAWAEAKLELEGRGPDELEHAEDEEAADEGDEEMTESKEKSEQMTKEKAKPKKKAAKSAEEKPKKESAEKGGEKKAESKAKKGKGNGKAIEREGSAQWEGTIKKGRGGMHLGAARAIEMPYSFGSRFESEKATNPEELIGAAHAGCFSMALAKILEGEGYTPKVVETTATVSLAKEDDGFRITTIALEVKGEVEEIDEETFEELAEKAGEECPVSKALAGVEISVSAMLR